MNHSNSWSSLDNPGAKSTQTCFSALTEYLGEFSTYYCSKMNKLYLCYKIPNDRTYIIHFASLTCKTQVHSTFVGILCWLIRLNLPNNSYLM